MSIKDLPHVTVEQVLALRKAAIELEQENTAYRISLENLEAKKDQIAWVSVDEFKPKQGERVLLMIDSDDCQPYVVGYWGCGEWEACTINIEAEKDYNGNIACVERSFESNDVTHWQPLPPTQEA